MMFEVRDFIPSTLPRAQTFLGYLVQVQPCGWLCVDSTVRNENLHCRGQDTFLSLVPLTFGHDLPTVNCIVKEVICNRLE